ncbi:unnamed protein product [Linum trigynum]|uniref:Non-specific lipid-transfer protein n=1 Tax=Linum trigynum TaxID=586398 RepID=A0AAV2GLN7_9ROSI
MAATNYKLQVYVALIVVVMVAAGGRHLAADGVVTCSQVAADVAPCFNYITGRGPLVPACCGGIRSLKAAAGSTPERQAACRCLKALLIGGVPGVNFGIAGGLPNRCGVVSPAPVSPTVDCNRVR